MTGRESKMRSIGLLSGCLAALGIVSTGAAAEISGEYLEARTCDVYTGPCFANGEIGIAGKEAVMAWKVDEGQWAGEDLAGLGVALVITANDTLGFGGTRFSTRPDKITAVILVDEKANEDQQAALVQFVKQSAPHLTTD